MAGSTVRIKVNHFEVKCNLTQAFHYDVVMTRPRKGELLSEHDATLVARMPIILLRCLKHCPKQSCPVSSMMECIAACNCLLT